MGIFDIDNEFVTMRVEGLDALEKKVDRMGDDMRRKGIREALKVGALFWKDIVVQEAPINQDPTPQAPAGFLKGHFNIATRAVSAEPEGRAYIGPMGKVDYPYYQSGAYKSKINKKTGKRMNVGRIAVASVARFLQFGTSKMAANPFMSRAFQRGKGIVEEAVKLALDDFIQRNT